MILLDASAVIAFLRGEPAEAEVLALLHAGECGITSVNVAEVADKLARLDRRSEEEVEAELYGMGRLGRLTFLDVSAAMGFDAGFIRARYYDRLTSPISMADCVLLAVGIGVGAEAIATSDAPLATAARNEGVEVVALPDPTGSRP